MNFEIIFQKHKILDKLIGNLIDSPKWIILSIYEKT